MDGKDGDNVSFVIDKKHISSLYFSFYCMTLLMLFNLEFSLNFSWRKHLNFIILSYVRLFLNMFLILYLYHRVPKEIKDETEHQENKDQQELMVEWVQLVKSVHKVFVESQETQDHQE